MDENLLRFSAGNAGRCPGNDADAIIGRFVVMRSSPSLAASIAAGVVDHIRNTCAFVWIISVKRQAGRAAPLDMLVRIWYCKSPLPIPHFIHASTLRSGA